MQRRARFLSARDIAIVVACDALMIAAVVLWGVEVLPGAVAFPVAVVAAVLSIAALLRAALHARTRV